MLSAEGIAMNEGESFGGALMVEICEQLFKGGENENR